MSGKRFTLSPINPNGEQYIQATESSYDEETGLGVQKRGLILVKPEKAEEVMAKLSAGEYGCTFGAKQRGTSLYDVTVVTEPVEVED